MKADTEAKLLMKLQAAESEVLGEVVALVIQLSETAKLDLQPLKKALVGLVSLTKDWEDAEITEDRGQKDGS